MNKSSVLCASLAGLASVASAQNFSLSMVGVPATIDTSSGPTSFTVDVIGDADVGTHYLGGAFAVESNSPCIFDMVWSPSAWSAFNTDGGYAGNGNYNQVVFGQLVIPGIFPPAPGSELGNVIGSFVFTIAGGDFGNVDVDLVAGSPFTLETVDSVTGQTFQSSSGNLALNGFRLSIIPSPGVMSLFVCSGFLASRRRR